MAFVEGVRSSMFPGRFFGDQITLRQLGIRRPLLAAVSMGRRNTRMKARRLDFGLQSLLELSEKLEQQWSPMIE